MERLFVDLNDLARGLGVFWNLDKIEMTLIEQSSQWMHCRVIFKADNKSFHISNVYGLTKTKKKFNTWQEIIRRNQSVKDECIILGGYFNTLLNPSKKKWRYFWSE